MNSVDILHIWLSNNLELDGELLNDFFFCSIQKQRLGLGSIDLTIKFIGRKTNGINDVSKIDFESYFFP